LERYAPHIAASFQTRSEMLFAPICPGIFVILNYPPRGIERKRADCLPGIGWDAKPKLPF